MAPTPTVPTTGSVTLERPVSLPIPTTLVLNGHYAAKESSLSRTSAAELSPTSHRVAMFGLLGMRLLVGFYFVWAFVDKTFGLGYHTSAAHAWLNGGSPTTGFLSGANVGPFQGIFQALAGSAAVDWLFMLGLLGVGVALVLGVALRPAAVAGSAMLLLMYLASWPFATVAGGQPTGSTNPFVDDHIIDTVAIIIVAAFAAWSMGTLSRRWAALGFVKSHSWLR